jgi:hypothetical protein
MLPAGMANPDRAILSNFSHYREEAEGRDLTQLVLLLLLLVQ